MATYTIRNGKLVEVPKGGLKEGITLAGDSLRTGPPTQNYLDNYDRIFRGEATETVSDPPEASSGQEEA